MSLASKLAAAPLLAGLLIASPAWAAADLTPMAPEGTADPGLFYEIEAKYEFSLLGFGVGEMYFHITMAGDTYETRASVDPQGIADWFDANAIRAEASGEIDSGAIEPSQSWIEQRNSDSRRSVTIAFEELGLPVVTSDPPYKISKYAPTPDQITGAVDPVSGLLLMLTMPGASGDPCDMTIPVYDGRRRYDFMVEPKGRVNVDEENVYSGEAIYCMARYQRIAGWKPEKMSEGSRTRVHAWLVPVGEKADGTPELYVPVKLWGDAGIDDAVGRALWIKVNGQPLAALQ